MLLLHCVATTAQTHKPNLPFIEVSGTAVREIEPDEIYVAITLSEKSIDNKKYSIENQEEKLNQILKSLSVDRKNLQLSDLNSEILRNRRSEIGFKQSKEYLLKLSNSNDVSAFFRLLFEANIKEADVVKTHHTKLAEYTKQTRIDAIKAARDKAEYLLQAVGKIVDSPIEILEGHEPEYDNFNYYRANAYTGKAMSENDAGDETISSSEFKKIRIRSSYRVKYSIK